MRCNDPQFPSPRNGFFSTADRTAITVGRTTTATIEWGPPHSNPPDDSARCGYIVHPNTGEIAAYTF